MAELEDAELTFPHKYVKTTPTSGTILTENWRWREDACTNEVVREIHMESGRKERRMVRLGSAPPGGSSEKRGDEMDGDLPGGVSSLKDILGIPVLGSRTDKTSPLGWWEGW